MQPDPNLPWWFAILAGLAVCAGIGAIHGVIITRLGLPAFVVTLAGYLLWFGVMIIILGPAGGVSITSTVLPNQQAMYGIVYTYLKTYMVAHTSYWQLGLGVVLVALVLVLPTGIVGAISVVGRRLRQRRSAA